MGKLYSITFSGQVADGFTLTDVKQSFAQRFGKSEDVIERLFTGNTVTLAKNIAADRAKADGILRS